MKGIQKTSARHPKLFQKVPTSFSKVIFKDIQKQAILKLSMGVQTIPGHQAIDMLPNYKMPRQLQERDMVRRYTNGKGEARICGGKDLKGSQAYPKGFLGQTICFGW